MNDPATLRRNRRLVVRMLCVAVAMFAFGFAMVPLYDVLCDLTGLNGKPSDRVARAEDYAVDGERLVTVQFLTTVNHGSPWEFAPATYQMEVHPGQPYDALFVARNRTDQVKLAQAVPSVVPSAAARYFRKTECFCFNQQQFQAHERKEMPLRFIVDPALPRDISTVTLSYTFFDLGQVAAN